MGKFLQFILALAICVLILFLSWLLFADIDYTSIFPNFGTSTPLPPDDSTSDDSSSGGGGDHVTGKATLYRTQIRGYRLQDGVLTPFTDDTPVDFTNATSENLFGIQEGEVVVPGCLFEATMSLSNDGNVTLNYWMEIRMTSEFDTQLAEQLQVKLAVNGKDYSTIVGQPLGGERAPLGTLAKGEHISFTVSVEFIEHANNNAAQGQSISFDLYVTTAQAA